MRRLWRVRHAHQRAEWRRTPGVSDGMTVDRRPAKPVNIEPDCDHEPHKDSIEADDDDGELTLYLGECHWCGSLIRTVGYVDDPHTEQWEYVA